MLDFMPRGGRGQLIDFQNTHLNRQQLYYCVSLIENGVNPEALAVILPLMPSLRGGHEPALPSRLTLRVECD